MIACGLALAEFRLMAKINLLPWRTERRKLREREFYMMLGAAVVAGILAVLAVGLLDGCSASRTRKTATR